METKTCAHCGGEVGEDGISLALPEVDDSASADSAADHAQADDTSGFTEALKRRLNGKLSEH